MLNYKQIQMIKKLKSSGKQNITIAKILDVNIEEVRKVVYVPISIIYKGVFIEGQTIKNITDGYYILIENGFSHYDTIKELSQLHILDTNTIEWLLNKDGIVSNYEI